MELFLKKAFKMIRNRIFKILLWFKKCKYLLYSINSNFSGTYRSYQPVVIRGKGNIHFGENVCFGVVNSPMFLNAYAYIESRNEKSTIIFGDNININNAFSIISEKKIVIGSDVLIGYNCQISDSNFHDLNPNDRLKTDPNPEEVNIRANVFIGNNVTILKGVTIGKNSVIATGSIVTNSCDSNVVIAGSPAKVIRYL